LISNWTILVGCDGRPGQRFWLPSYFLGHKLSIPAEDCVGASDGCDLAQHLAAKRLAESGEAATLAIGQPDTTTELPKENAVLFLQVLDRPLLVLGDPGADQSARN
jgi:hypothetical protein